MGTLEIVIGEKGMGMSYCAASMRFDLLKEGIETTKINPKNLLWCDSEKVKKDEI